MYAVHQAMRCHKREFEEKEGRREKAAEKRTDPFTVITYYIIHTEAEKHAMYITRKI